MLEFHERIVDGLRDGDVPSFAIEPKLDGASIEVIYDGGKLVQATTRGDGEEGEEITPTVPSPVGSAAVIASPSDGPFNSSLLTSDAASATAPAICSPFVKRAFSTLTVAVSR